MTRHSGFGRPGSQRALFPRSFYAVTAFLISWSCGLLSVAHLNAATIVSELGAAGPANFTVLSLGGNTGQINFTGSGTINGNAGMPNSGEYVASGSADLTGILYLGSQSSKKISGSAKIQGGTQQNTKSNSLLNSAVQAADAASSYFAGLPPTPVSITCTPKCTSLPFQTMGSGAKFTITGTKAVNVLDLKGINIPHGATVTFYSKVAGAEFVINNSGPFQLASDVTITVAGTVSPYAVLLNHTGNEEVQISSGSALTGIILAPIAAIQIESATFTGEVIGGKNAAVQISGQTKLIQPSIAVPNVVGATQSAATTEIEAVGLILGTVTTASSSTVPSGDVISESPTAGKLVEPGSAVNLVVSSGSAEVAVPNVVGSTQAAATSAIRAAGLVVGTVTTAPSSTVPSGSVISESPAAGTMVNVGSAVNLVISSGPAQVAVPNVVGLTQAAATSAIKAAGLIVGTVTTAPSSTIPSGSVISENPTAGTMVNAGSAVNLVISSGPGQVAVPNVVGSTQAAATTAIQNAGLVVGTVTTQSSSTVPSGDVISETPTAGTMVNAGSAVNLVISSGPAQVAVPNVVGSTQAAATSAIKAAGLVVGTITTAPSNTVPSGSVISESPTAGTMVNVGSAVNLVVSSGPGQVSVPNVVGSTQAAATTAIQNAGLVVGTVTTHSSSTVPSGDVISETPSAGTMVNAGSAVNLVISSGPAQVAVPNVVGSTQAAATTAIQNAGLVVGTVTTASSSTVPSGDVISETPAAGTMVNAGSAVNLVISSGPAQVAVPNVVGSTQAAATTAIQNAGLVVGTVTTASSSTVPSGDVISETPAAGTMVPSGSGVNLVISTGAAPISITGFSPQSGPIGTLVNVTLSNFTPVQGTTPQVALASSNGGSINAPVSTQATNALSFVVPAGAGTGKFSVTFSGQTATSSSAFTVSTSSNFTLAVGPSTANLIPGQSVAYAVTVNSSNGFDALANLSVTGVPSGVTASFAPTGVTAGQTSVLTLSAPANQGTGAAQLSITASATIDGQAVTQSQNATLQVTGITTSFLGRTVVDDAQQTPIAGVTVKFLGLDAQGNSTGCSLPQTTSDAAGNFSFTSLPQSCTGPQLISYNGMTATSPAGKYAGVNLSYTLTSGQVTTSPVLIHLPRIDNGETVQVQQNASTNQVFTFQSIPGLVVTVYAGTTFTLDDGTHPNPFPLIAIEIPLDRLPDQMATSGMVTPFIVAFQPANAVASQPVAVNFPILSAWPLEHMRHS